MNSVPYAACSTRAGTFAEKRIKTAAGRIFFTHEGVATAALGQHALALQ